MPDPTAPASFDPDLHGADLGVALRDAAGRCRHGAEPPGETGGSVIRPDVVAAVAPGFVSWATLETAMGPRRIMSWTKRRAPGAVRRRR
ncbi:hypothetical protein KBI52_19125 [Microvirga sp. HBU67558]|uniref:hypothetical protein n=1 Tax=Microvirga TaxID=186650 RepID=UPI001B364B85|nr:MULTISPECIES: hypothetical protein [unclassified Microvirga]MBQ0822305.1 hypothetical protein [Microvirga sp. HBU67558]